MLIRSETHPSKADTSQRRRTRTGLTGRQASMMPKRQEEREPEDATSRELSSNGDFIQSSQVSSKVVLLVCLSVLPSRLNKTPLRTEVVQSV